MSEIGSLLLVPSLLALQPPPAPQDERETIVSARKFEEPLGDVPMSVTALSLEELEVGGLESMRDAAARVPNLYLSEFTARRLSFPFVRGVGSGNGDPAVLTYVDDVPQFGFGGVNLPLFRAERVEFLRGPQGTLYGKNALGGLIHVHGRRPTGERELGAEASFGSFDLSEYSAGYSGPLGGGVLGDVGLMTSRRDGYSKNDFTGNTVDDRDGTFGRGRALWNPTLNSELDFSVFGEHARDGGFAISFLDPLPAFGVTGLEDRPHRINHDFEGETERDVLGPSLAWRVFGESTDFVSVTSYQSWDVLETSDFDFTPVDGVRRESEEDQDYVYQELRLGTAAARALPGEFAWVLGASGFTADGERSAANEFRPGGSGIFFPPGSEGTDSTSGDFDDLGLALFGNVSLPVSERIDLAFGLRYDREEKEVARLHTFDPGGGPIVLGQDEGEETFAELVPSASASFHADRATLVYLRAAEGWKAGGFNLSAPAGSEEFDEETAWCYELGVRRSFDEERYTLAAAAFFIDWEDMQLSQFDPVAGGFVENAGAAESQGIELEGQAALGRGFDANASVGVLDTHIDEFVDSFGNDTSGNELPQAPDSTWAVGLQYTGEVGQQGSWFVRGDYQDVGDFFYDAGNLRGDSFSLVNLRAGLTWERFGLTLWCKNAFDEEYIPIAFQPSPVDPSTFVGESGAPRVLGFTLSVHL